MPRVRDSRRKRLYDSEDTVRHAMAEPTLTLEECQALVSRIYADPWTHRHFHVLAGHPPRVTSGAGGTSARYLPGLHRIALPEWSRTTMVVLHEVAHSLQPRCGLPCSSRGLRVCRNEALHGWHFAQIQLLLVRHVLGVEAHRRLRAAFKEGGVRYTMPRKKAA